MSFHRENVAWQSRDGKWNIGFYECYQNNFDDDADPEWDVDYNFDRFEWVTTGHATEEEAWRHWHGANPGGGSVYTEPSAETDRLDRMAAEFGKPASALSSF